jgi:hypothetical protein
MSSPTNAEGLPDDGFAGDDPQALLAEARVRAEKLLNHLVAEQAEIEKNPPKISAEALVEGRAAMAKAIDAARRTVEAIEAAIEEAASGGGDGVGDDDAHHWN